MPSSSLGQPAPDGQVNNLHGALINAEQIHIGLQTEHAMRRDALTHATAELSSAQQAAASLCRGQPEVYADSETQKELLAEAKQQIKS